MSPVYIIAATLSVWLALLTFLVVRLMNHYSKLTGGVNQKDLISSLNSFISISEKNSDEIKKLSSTLSHEIHENRKHIQRIGFKRYNPFTDTGGDQSFTFTALDENGDGIMISSLHSRENTRLYAKKVEGGKVANQTLSTEEKLVISEALK